MRKRIHQKHELYPHPDKWKKLIDKVIYPVSLLGPVFTIPQLLEVYVSKNASGLSLATWMLWVFSGSVWLIYGIMHNEKPIIISHIAWIIVEVGVIIGILLYG
ncbi:PQ-loop domain-containing transporter [Patescibacteria group bacterium]